MHTALEVIGWASSVLIVVSLAQARVLRFRWLNLVGSVVAVGYNAAVGVWPFAAMNTVTAAISAYWLIRLYREAKDPAVYQVLPVGSEEPYLQHVLSVHAPDIASHAPAFEAHAPAQERRLSFLVVRGDEAVGVVALKDRGHGVADIELDWVKPRFRDFGPGQFVFQESGALPAAGITRVELQPHAATDTEYLTRAGFVLQGDRWVRELAAA